MLKLRFFLIFVILLFAFLLFKDNLTINNQLEVDRYECTIDDHLIHFSLPSKYKRLGEGKVPSIYSDVVYVDYRDIRNNMFIADTLRTNFFLYKRSIASKKLTISDIIRGCKLQMPMCEKMYDFIEEKLDNGYDKFVFVGFHPSKISNMEKEEYGICIYINCFVKLADDFLIEFKIRSFEPLAEFNYQEKMDIINSIYVE